MRDDFQILNDRPIPKQTDMRLTKKRSVPMSSLLVIKRSRSPASLATCTFPKPRQRLTLRRYPWSPSGWH